MEIEGNIPDEGFDMSSMLGMPLTLRAEEPDLPGQVIGEITSVRRAGEHWVVNATLQPGALPADVAGKLHAAGTPSGPIKSLEITATALDALSIDALSIDWGRPE